MYTIGQVIPFVRRTGNRKSRTPWPGGYLARIIAGDRSGPGTRPGRRLRGRPGGGTSLSRSPIQQKWYLEGSLGHGRSWLTAIEPLPFVIGRSDRCHLRLSSREISRMHAEIHQHDSGLLIRDLESTNGTFLNGKRLQGEGTLADGDILHFGSVEFRVRSHRPPPPVREFNKEDLDKTGLWQQPLLSHQFERSEKEFRDMLRLGEVSVVFQPIVNLASGTVHAYEALGRTGFPGLPPDPGGLFRIAEHLGLEIELSELFLSRAVDLGKKLSADRLFLNLHPAQMDLERLLPLVEKLASSQPAQTLVIEINEKAVTRIPAMKQLRERLGRLGMELAYDDFGAGRTRLLELMEVPPDYLKFDMALIQDIHHQPEQFHQTMELLVRMAANLKIHTLAEGIETGEEADICRGLGFELGQGFLYGRPIEVQA